MLSEREASGPDGKQDKLKNNYVWKVKQIQTPIDAAGEEASPPLPSDLLN